MIWRKELVLTQEQVEQFLRSRRIIRNFKSQPVERHKLEKLLEIACFAPSAKNSQPWYWTVVEDPADVRRFSEMVIDWMRNIIAQFPEIDMAPVAPHTTVREARPCVSCHASTKALGYGTHGGRYMRQFTKDVYVDLTTVEGKPLSRNAMIQISSIPDLPMGLDQVVTRDGQQVQTVGHHWPGSRPLNKKQRDNMERIGVCLSCHQNIPNGTPSIKRLSQMLKNSSRTPSTDEEHRALLQSIIVVAKIMFRYKDYMQRLGFRANPFGDI